MDSSNSITNELFKRLGTNHLTTSPHHPQCNSQAEVANKTIAKYLASFCDDSTLDWELYLAPLMFSYNTSFHRSIKSSPFFLTFGMEPRLPTLPTPDLRRKFYGESTTDDIIRKLLFARDVAKLADPLATMQINRELDQGLILRRITCPLGVLGVIFEARPDALIQITSLAIKSGNGVILKGGKEAIRSCQALVTIIHQALSQTKVNPAAVRLLTTREEIQELLKLDQYIDLIIPRGSNEFVRYIQNNTRIPVLGHADGICHLYIDKEADLSKAIRITVDGKTQYPAACNTIETLLVHQDIARQFLPAVAQALEEKKVKLLGDEATRQMINVPSATEQDWQTEYSDLILSIKIV